MERDRVEPVIREVVAASPRPIAAAWLFGSIARGTERADSDVDVALLYSEPPKGILADLPAELESELTTRLGREVQVVVMNRAPAELAMSVLNEDRLLFERDAACRVEWEIRVRNEYWDLAPLLAIYRRAGEMAP